MCEYPDVSSSSEPVARKTHFCCECLLPIPKGTRYSLFKGCWQGEWNTYKSHTECRDWSVEVMREAGEGIPFGGLIEDHTFDREHHKDVRKRYASILIKYRGTRSDRKRGWRRTWDAMRYIYRKRVETQTAAN